jgi:hypothetical protein
MVGPAGRRHIARSACTISVSHQVQHNAAAAGTPNDRPPRVPAEAMAGARRNDRALRWLGLAAMLATTAKVFLFDMATLEGVVRAASFLALGSLLLAGALVARRLGAGGGARADEAAASADSEGQAGT